MTGILDDILILDFTQFLSGPSASLRLADLGARVIKIERPEKGDLCRSLYVSNCDIHGESSLFQAINRNKESICLDLKNDSDKQTIATLIKRADVVLNNFRPGVMEKLGLDYGSIKAINPKIIYGEISGYGKSGPWKDKPGQDLLLQSLSGLAWLSGNADDGPVPMGVAIVDILAGAQLAQAILAALFNLAKANEGMHVSVSMLEAILDFQFEPLTIYYQDGGQPLTRSKTNSAHPLVAGAYGIYETSNGFIAISMGAIPQLGELLDCAPLLKFDDPNSWFELRDAIKQVLSQHLRNKSTQYWLDILEPADIWCADVLDWKALLEHPGFTSVNMLQQVKLAKSHSYTTTRCPIRIDGEVLISNRGAPTLGENQQSIFDEFIAGN